MLAPTPKPVASVMTSHRLNDLTATVPVLREVVGLRDGLATAERTLTDRRILTKRLTAAREAKRLREEIDRATNFIDAAEGAQRLRDELGRFDPNLMDKLAAARSQLQVETDAMTTALGQRPQPPGYSNRPRPSNGRSPRLGLGCRAPYVAGR